MKQETFYEVVTLGELGRDGAEDTERWQRPSGPSGCHWFVDCEACRWDDCINSRPVAYHSEKGKRMRGTALAGMLRAGMPLPWLAAFFGMTEDAVEEEAKPYVHAAIPAPDRRSRDPVARKRLKAAAVRMRQNNKPEALVASMLGVSARQVRRWCQGQDSIVRNDGNRWRSTLAALPLKGISGIHSVSFQRQCVMVRQYNERAYAGSLQSACSGSVGNTVQKACNLRETRTPLE